jgi:hypothetical protein
VWGGGRLLARVKGAAAFTVGAALSAGLVYGGLGAVGGLLGGPRVFGPAAAILLGWSGIWYLRGGGHVPFGRPGVQAKRALVTRGYIGLSLFGAILGVGLLTEMSTPLVQAGCGLALAQQPLFGLCYGMGFGLGRSTGPWIGALAPRRLSMQSLAQPFLDWKANSRWLGLILTTLPMAYVLSLIWPRAHLMLFLSAWRIAVGKDAMSWRDQTSHMPVQHTRGRTPQALSATNSSPDHSCAQQNGR